MGSVDAALECAAYSGRAFQGRRDCGGSDREGTLGQGAGLKGGSTSADFVASFPGLSLREFCWGLLKGDAWRYQSRGLWPWSSSSYWGCLQPPVLGLPWRGSHAHVKCVGNLSQAFCNRSCRCSGCCLLAVEGPLVKRGAPGWGAWAGQSPCHLACPLGAGYVGPGPTRAWAASRSVFIFNSLYCYKTTSGLQRTNCCPQLTSDSWPQLFASC